MNATEQFYALNTIVVKEVRRFMRIWVQTLVPPVITMVLYFIIFGNLIGSRIGKMSGIDYMQYIIPGLIMMSVITNAYSNVVSSFFSMKFQKSIEEMLVSPLPEYIILVGFVIGGVARGIGVGLLVFAISYLFADLEVKHIGITTMVVILTAIVFSLAGFMNAIFAKSFDDVSIIPTFVLTPLIYLGGVFYSIDMLPEFWQNVSLANPLLYMVNGFRFGVLGVSDIGVWYSVSMLIFLIVVLFFSCLHLLKTGYGTRT